jgi:phage shock protein E
MKFMLLGLTLFVIFIFTRVSVKHDKLSSQVILVDVRTLEEWNQGHHPSSIHIPIDRLVFDLENTIPDKTSPILFCCKRGIRSEGAAVIAKNLGYENISYTGSCTSLI